jgi:type I restriction enzyme S subunit
MIDGLLPYPVYKDSGVPWLEQVPEHWRLERAKWLFRKMDRSVREADEVVTCFRDGLVTLRKNRRVRGFTESIKEIGYQGIRRGDLVIHAMDAFAGAVGVADSDGKGTPVYSVCEPKPGVDAHYYAYVVREMARTSWIQALAKGIRERSTDFRFDGFGSQSVPLPRPLEQTAVVRFLNHAERLIRRYIRSKKKLVALLNEQKQAAIHRAVTRGLDPNVKLKPSVIPWLGAIPEHWGTYQVRSLGRVVRGGSPRPAGSPLYFHGDAEPWITVGELTKDSSMHLHSTSTRLTTLGAQRSRTIEPGTLLLTNSGATLGIPKISAIRGCINDGVAAFDGLSRDVIKEYLYYYWTTQTAHLKARVDLGAQPNLNTQIIGGWPVLLPPKMEQERIAHYATHETSLFQVAISKASPFGGVILYTYNARRGSLRWKRV